MRDVLIVGAGPVGLFLAAELKLQGHAPMIIERLPEPTGLSKALGLQATGVDLLAARGLLPRFERETMPALPGGGFHFAGLPLAEPSRFLFILQARVEAVLEAHLASLDVRVQRGVEFEALDEGADRVHVSLRSRGEKRDMKVRYLVGCDGGSSSVRKAAGIDFPGTEPTLLLRLGDVRLPGVKVTAEGLLLPSGERAPFGILPIDDGYFRIVVREPYPKGFDRKAPLAFDELQAAARRCFGIDLPMTEPRWLSRFTDAAHQAAVYRKGRVLVAGDAAHIHLPAGGPGISTGMNDAANLAWRLSAVLGGHHPDDWLDGYAEERHAAGARVLEHTLAQSALLPAAPSANVRALRGLLGEVLQIPEARRFIARRVEGADTRYGSDSNPLVGRWMPVPVDLRRGRFVLFANGIHNEWGERLEVRPADGSPMLIRPDGFVAWAGDGDASAALTHWLGAPRPGP